MTSVCQSLRRFGHSRHYTVVRDREFYDEHGKQPPR
jgi:hypothetical protein